MDGSTPGPSALHHLPELAQIHVPRVSDAIQPSHPLSPPSPPALNLSQHQGLFQWVSSSHHVTKRTGASASILPMNIQGWSPLGLTGLISLIAKRLSRVFSSTTIWKHQYFDDQPSLWLILTSGHDYWINHSFCCKNRVGKVIFLLFSMLSRLVIAFLPRRKHF